MPFSTLWYLSSLMGTTGIKKNLQTSFKNYFLIGILSKKKCTFKMRNNHAKLKNEKHDRILNVVILIKDESDVKIILCTETNHR